LNVAVTPLSALDLAIVSVGETSADALGYTTAMARHAEALGFHRFWVAEHHNMRTVASTTRRCSSPVAAATERIRVGSGA
jgi:alkanesulfonate monooxygenase SsuD/methylene tetrahydromethanopterin reductase-like flavin-dependent oxidoreductase (luciferase family)